MYNYYVEDKAQRERQKVAKSQEQIQQRILYKQKKDLQMVVKYEERVFRFLKQMQQKPFMIYDSLYKRSRNKPRDNTKRWLNASAMHSLDVYQDSSLRQRKKHTNHSNYVEAHVVDPEELKIIDEFQPQKLIPNDLIDYSHEYHFYEADQRTPQVKKQHIRVNTERKLPPCKGKGSGRQQQVGRLYFNGIKALTVQRSVLQTEDSSLVNLDQPLPQQARETLKTCNVMTQKLL